MKHDPTWFRGPREYVATITTTTLGKRVSFLTSSVEWIAETEEGTTIHFFSGKHVTTSLAFDKVFTLLWDKTRA